MTISANDPAVRAKLVDGSADLNDPRSILGMAQGRVASAQRGFGDEVLLRIEPSEPEARADWRVGTQASDWVLASLSSVLPGAHASSTAVDAALAELQGADVEELTVTDSLALVVIFADGRWLEVNGFSDDPEEREDDPPYWEVFTPDDELLRAGPGPLWVQSALTARASAQTSRPSLTELAIDDLLKLWSAVTTELRRRGVVRTIESPTGSAMGQTAEALAHARFGGFRGTYDRAGWDILTDAGERIEVKALRQGDRQRLPQLWIAHLNFDALVVVLFGDEFTVIDAWYIPKAVVVQHLHLSLPHSGRVELPLPQLIDDPYVRRVAL